MRTSALAKPVRLGLSLHDTPDDFESSDEEKDRPSITASPQKNSKVVRKEKNNALEFHLYAAKKAPLELPSLGQRSPTTPDSVHSAIQTTWGLFNGMSDSQRNQLLAGLLSRCSSKQVEYICTMLNLKMVDVNSKHRVRTLIYIQKYQTHILRKIEKLVPQEIARKFPARKNVLKGIRGKEE